MISKGPERIIIPSLVEVSILMTLSCQTGPPGSKTGSFTISDLFEMPNLIILFCGVVRLRGEFVIEMEISVE